MAARWSAWVVWAACAASAVFWGLRLGVPSRPLSPQVQTVGGDQVARGDVLRLFAAPPVLAGVPAAQPGAASRLKLFGVVAGDRPDSPNGWALMSLDGQPPRSYRVGMVVDGAWVVQRVTRNQVQVGPAGEAAVAVLDLPDPAPAAIGQLPTAKGGLPVATQPGIVPPPVVVPPPDQPPADAPIPVQIR